MISGSSLVNSIPLPSGTPVTELHVPAAVSVSEVVEPEANQSAVTGNFVTNFIDKYVQKYVQKRMEKLESTPIEKLSELERAELEANRTASANYLA